MSTSCHFADLEYCTTKDAKGKAIAVQITTRNTVCCSSIGLQVFSCSTRFSVQQNVARLVLLSTAYRWVMTRCDTNSAQGGVCGFFRTCTAATHTKTNKQIVHKTIFSPCATNVAWHVIIIQFMDLEPTKFSDLIPLGAIQNGKSTHRLSCDPSLSVPNTPTCRDRRICSRVCGMGPS